MNPKLTMNMAGLSGQPAPFNHAQSGIIGISQNANGMMISGNASQLNASSNIQDGFKMKHNSSNQSIQSQKKIGISAIRKVGGNIALEQSFNSQNMHNNGN